MGAERSPIITVSVGVVFPVALVFSLYLLFAGHNAPGGGFVGGLVAGAAFVLRYASGGVPEVDRATPITPPLLLGGGLALAVTSGALGWLAGGDYLESGIVELDVPVLGTVKTTTSLLFDLGVYLTVVGLVLTVLRMLGREVSR